LILGSAVKVSPAEMKEEGSRIGGQRESRKNLGGRGDLERTLKNTETKSSRLRGDGFKLVHKKWFYRENFA